MLKVICGEDSSASRSYLNDLKNEYEKKEYEILNISSGNIEEIDKWIGESQSLFNTKKVFLIENLNKKLSRKSTPRLFTLIDKYIASDEVEIVDWEDELNARFLKIPKTAEIKEFKLAQSIFKLQDACYPGNLKLFVNMLHEICKSNDEIFIFIMLIRHFHLILLTKMNVEIPKIQSWQLAKYRKQADLWDKNKLIAFYESLHKLDISFKTSNNPFSVINSLDILACYYL